MFAPHRVCPGKCRAQWHHWPSKKPAYRLSSASISLCRSGVQGRGNAGAQGRRATGARGRASARVREARGARGARGVRAARGAHKRHGPTLSDTIFLACRATWILAGDTWCSDMTPAQRAGGPGCNPQRVQFTFEAGEYVSRAI